MIRVEHREIDGYRERVVAVYDCDAATLEEALREAQEALGVEAPGYLWARWV